MKPVHPLGCYFAVLHLPAAKKKRRRREEEKKMDAQSLAARTSAAKAQAARKKKARFYVDAEVPQRTAKDKASFKRNRKRVLPSPLPS